MKVEQGEAGDRSRHYERVRRSERMACVANATLVPDWSSNCANSVGDIVSPVTTVDVSAGGVAVNGSLAVRVGQRVLFRLSRSQTTSLSLRGTLVHAIKKTGRRGAATFGIAFDAADRKVMEWVLAHRWSAHGRRTMAESRVIVANCPREVLWWAMQLPATTDSIHIACADTRVFDNVRKLRARCRVIPLEL